MQQLANTVRVTRKSPSPSELPSIDPRELPPQVGNTWDDPLFRGEHAKYQRLYAESRGRDHGAPVTAGSRHPEALPQLRTTTAEELLRLFSRPKAGPSSASGSSATAPGAQQEMVLNFLAYFTEAVPETIEKVRVRKVTISFFPTDASVRIQEPVIPNSGLRGGLFLQRGQVPATSRQREVFPNEPVVNLNHLYVGAVVCIYAIDYHIYDCEPLTRQILEANGCTVAPAMPAPSDTRPPTGAPPAAPAGTAPHQKGSEGIVLNFSAYQDDREAPGGAIRLFNLYYFVDDDTVAITERSVSGERVPSAFLSRRRLPRRDASKAVELTFAARINGHPEADIGPDGYYGMQDMYVGQTLRVYGRELHLYDCDGFTRDFYEKRMGIVQGSAVDIKPLLPSNPQPPSRPPPPPTGFGAEEDSLVSCKSLVLKPPKKREPRSNRILRFELRLHDPSPPEERMRKFVLVYYESSHEGMVHEMPIRNTGYVGGKFMARQKLQKAVGATEYYASRDIQVGEQITLNGFKFDVVDSDERTKRMFSAAQGSDDVSTARVQQLLKILHGYCVSRYFTATEAFLALDRDRDGVVSASELATVLSSIEVASDTHDAHAMFDALDEGQKGFISFDDVLLFVTHGKGQMRCATPERRDLRDNQSQLAARKRLRASVLRRLHAVLEGKCINAFEMFRIMSTMPRAYKGTRSLDLMALTNASRDCYITPTQLCRGVQEVLGLALNDAEMDTLQAFFFPPSASPTNEPRGAVDLMTFHRLFCEMDALCQLQ